jgi:pSer/pThr/pTyr-binding forkhead associated (FHA) protein
MLHLTVHHSALEGTEYWLTRPVITVGRHADNDIVIDSLGVAPSHARLSVDNGGAYRIEALEGMLGTFVNGQRIRSAVVEPGDRIRFGSVEAALTNDPAPAGMADTSPDPILAAGIRIAELEARLKSKETQMGDLARELTVKSNELARVQAELQMTRNNLAKSEYDRQVSDADWKLRYDNLTAELLDTRQQRDNGLAEQAVLLGRIEDTERRLADLDESARKRIQRGHDTISALRRKTAQQDSESREARYEIMKLRRGKEAADTLLESMKRCYSRDKKQHTRLVEQFRERARQEGIRAEQALLQLAKVSAAAQASQL